MHRLAKLLGLVQDGFYQIMVGAKLDKSDSDAGPVLPVGKRLNFSREFRREIVEKTMQPGASPSCRRALEAHAVSVR